MSAQIGRDERKIHAMPEVTLFCPKGIIWQPNAKLDALYNLRAVVAKHMGVDQPHVDVMLCTYERQDAVLSSSPFVIHIRGYDDPERMSTITIRLQQIASNIAHYLRDGSNVDQGFVSNGARGGDLVSVWFTPVPRGCWASAS